MDKAFLNLMYRFVLVYLDDITIFSKNVAYHFQHLRVIFKKCREYGISLDPKNNVFSIHKGKLLGFIVSKEDITIELERVSATLDLPLLARKKGLQSFLGRINFVRRFIPNIAELLMPLIAMLRKGMVFSWTKEGKHSMIYKGSISFYSNMVKSKFFKIF